MGIDLGVVDGFGMTAAEVAMSVGADEVWYALA